MKIKERGSMQLIVIIALLILITILLLLYFYCFNDAEEPLPTCGSEPFFSVAPLNDSQYVGLVPLGALNPPGHTFPTGHHYFYLVNPELGSTPPIVPVLMPGDAWVTNIAVSEHLSANPPFSDYNLSFKPCEDYEARFGHLFSLSTDLQLQMDEITPDCEEYSTGGEDYRSCRYRLRHLVNAGTEVGTTGGRIGQWALDFGAHDFRQSPLQWANQARFENHAEQMPYTTCPSEMFTPAVKSALEARFSNYNGTVQRTVVPVCGQIDQDVLNSAQGLWFQEGIDGVFPEDPHLSLVHDNVNPTVAVIAMGTSVALMTGSHAFSPTHSGLVNREFSEVTLDGNIFCYDVLGTGSLLLQLVTTTQLRVEYRSGAGCSVTPYNFTDTSVTFVR